MAAAGAATPAAVLPVPDSPTLALNDLARRRIEAGERIVHFGFGEARLPVHPLLFETLVGAAANGAYGPVGGSAALRGAIGEYLGRRGVEAAPQTIVASPGSKASLFALAMAIPGDVVVTEPSWVSYAGHAALLGKQVVRVPVPGDLGGIPDPALLVERTREARERGLKPTMICITNPDNPTGTAAPTARLEEVLTAAREAELLVFADEVYLDLAHRPEEVSSAAALDPDNVFLTGGLSKSLALGGWRVGFLRAPQTAFGEQVAGAARAIASQIWSCLPPPVEAAAQVAFEEPVEIRDYLAESRSLHRQVVEVAYDVVSAAGAVSRPPSGGFYVYPDMEGAREALAAKGITDGAGLAAALLEDFGVVVLPAVAFGEDPAALRFRVATSMLYGDDDAERREALAASRTGTAASLPRIATALERLGQALREVAA
jgi:aspartate aminotransferase